MPANKLRLHHAVARLLKTNNPNEFTGPEIHRNIENFGVLVDSKLENNRLVWIYDGQQIEIPNWPIRGHGDFSQIKILQENEYFLLLFKPYGIVVESGAGHQKSNLYSWLNTEYKELNGFNGQYYLVHRLDKFTQGLLLVAKSQTSLDFLQDQFRGRSVDKKYLALLCGELTERVEIENWQSRDHQNPLRNKFFPDEAHALAYDPQARNAKSIFRPLAFCPEMNQSIVQVQIKTGRMHQIRLQAEALGLPLVADSIYNKIQESTNQNQQAKFAITNPVNYKTFHQQAFTELKQNIFGNYDYGLLSNYLKIQLPDKTWLEAEYFDTTFLLS